MKLIIAILISLFVVPAYAQTGAPRSTAQLNTEINNGIPSGSTTITPATMRQILLDIVASSLGPQTGVSAAINTVLAGPATGTVGAAPTFRSLVAADLPPNLIRSSLGYTPQQVFNVDDYGAIGNGTTDDATAFSSAATACHTAGGGQIITSAKRYLIDGANITIPSGCYMYCPSPMQVTNTDNGSYFTTMKYVVILNSARRMILNSSSGWIGCALLQKAALPFLSNPDSIRNSINLRTAFAGVGLSLGVNNAQIGSDVTIKDTIIVGFDCGVMTGGETCGSTTPNATASHTARLYMDHVNIDANQCVWQDQALDVSTLTNVTCSPFMLNGKTQVANYTITGLANNGAGKYRVTTSAPTAIISGDTVWVSNTIVGASSAVGRWTATVINPQTIDLNGSSAAGVTPGGSTTLNSTLLTSLSSKGGIGVGSNISGTTGIAPGTTVVSVLRDTGGVVISQAAISTNVGVAFTVSDTAWSSGGTISLDADFGTGPGFQWNNTDHATCISCFVYDHSVGFYLSSGTNWISCISCSTDYNVPNTIDPQNIAVHIDSDAKESNFTNYTAISGPNLFVVNSTQDGHIIMNSVLDSSMTGGLLLELDNGSVQISNTTSTIPSRYVVIRNNADALVMTGNDLQNRFSAESNSSLSKTISSNNFNIHINTPAVAGVCGVGASVETNSTDYVGSATEGAAGPTTCRVTFTSPFYDVPKCVVTPQDVYGNFAYSVTNSQITVTHDSVSGQSFNWNCTSREGR